jgi:hypothetical protein
MRAMRSFTRALLMFSAGMLPLAAEFVPPAEGPLPFRRDKLPVDVDTMAALSRQVMVLARTTADSAKSPRAVAQMAALALALDPANREARALIDAMKSETPPPADGREEVERARNRAWQTLAWLEMPDAGADGQALAACLGDVLAVADPEHPKARERRTAGERGAWKDWVAEESAFRPKKPETPPEMTPEPGPEPEPERDKKAAVLALKDLSLPMPIWYHDKQANVMRLASVPVNLKARIDEGSEEQGPTRSTEVAGEGMTERFKPGLARLDAAIQARHGSLPDGLQLRFDFGKTDYSFTRNGLALTGTAALLLEGALTGKVPAATTLAVVGEDGKLLLPPRFWQTLRAFSAVSPGTRLILPDEAADFLTALVVMDDAAFFMKNEVLLAGSVDELCELAAAAPDAAIADGLKRFDEIRKVGQGKALGTFVAHPATQQRLRELGGVMPEHASARMLALQGSGSRPRFLGRPILAREVRAALEPAAYLVEQERDEIDPARLEEAHESSRERLDKLTGYIDIRDRDLLKAAVDMADSLRSLARLLPKKDPEGSSGLEQKQREAYEGACREYYRVMGELARAAGDSADFPPPEPPKD